MVISKFYLLGYDTGIFFATNHLVNGKTVYKREHTGKLLKITTEL